MIVKKTIEARNIMQDDRFRFAGGEYRVISAITIAATAVVIQAENLAFPVGERKIDLTLNADDQVKIFNLKK